MTHLVFVYGSLKAGFHNHRLLTDKGAADLGTCWTYNRYVMLKGAAFPFLIKPADIDLEGNEGLPGQVQGELYRVDDATLAALDILEGHPKFYRREWVALNNGVRAWCYFLTRPADRLDMDRLAGAAVKPDSCGAVEWRRDDVFADEED